MGSSNIMNEVVNTFFAASFIHGIFLTILITFGKKFYGVKYYVIGILVISCLWIFNYLIFTSSWILNHPNLLNLALPPLYLLGPLVYFMTNRISGTQHRFTLVDLLHFLPFIYISIVNIPTLLLPTTQKLEIVEIIFEGHRPGFGALMWQSKLNIYTLIYLIMGWITVGKGALKDKDLKSLKSIMTFLVCVFLAKILVVFFFWSIHVKPVYLESLMVIFMALLIHFIGYLFLKGRLNRRFDTTTDGNHPKYQTSPLNEKEIIHLKTKIISFLEDAKPYLRSNFTINELAENVDIPKHHLSQILNEGIGKNFFELINTYRVGEVIKRFEKGDFKEYSISGIGMECGFKSTSTFHRAFKKQTGTTPTAFIKSMKK